MAKVLGESGRYVKKQSTKLYQKQFLLLLIWIAALMLLDGYLLGIRKYPFAVLLTLLFLIIIFFSLKWVNRKIEEIETEKINFRKGAAGEIIIGNLLDTFPHDYYVINDLTTPFGNIDHVVIGPSGSYVIDTKHWKGTVSADSNGELLLNGKPTDKPEIKKFTHRLMDIQKKIQTLSSLDPFIQGVFVFPSAYIEAKWGTTGYVHCVRGDQLYEYIVENKRSKKLNQNKVDSISRAFMALARMDKKFESSTPGDK